MNVSIKKAGYEKNKPILTNIDFSVEPGQMVGLVGTNGAGKTTTIKSIVGVIDYLEGEITFTEGGIPYAFVPEQPVYYPYLTLYEHIQLLCDIHHLPITPEEIHSLLEEFRLFEVRNDFISSFSKGMKQKSSLLFALIQRPNLYILDEPFVGLDAIATVLLLKKLEEEKQRGASILLCTHVLDTAEKICDRFVWINDGQMVRNGTLSQLQELSGLQDASLMYCMEQLVGEK